MGYTFIVSFIASVVANVVCDVARFAVRRGR